jgi:hypothetical protein
MTHIQLSDAGQLTHFAIDDALAKLQKASENAPVAVTGARDTPEEALANLLTALETLGLITDSTTAS